MTGQSKAAVLRSMNDGTLPTSNIGNRRFIRTGKSCIQDIRSRTMPARKNCVPGKPFCVSWPREQFVPNGIELSELVKLGRQSSFCARATLFAENDPSVTVYMLTHGTARLYKMLHDGRSKLSISRCRVTFSDFQSPTDIDIRSMRSAKSPPLCS